MSHFYRPEIDVLRAIAVSSVVAYHLFPNIFNLGYLGVDLFFVISGYVVGTSLISLSSRKTSTLGYLSEFYSRRIVRLIPSLFLVVFLTTLISAILIPPIFFFEIRNLAFTSLVGAGNLYLLLSQNDYFDLSNEFLPLLHTWSLGVEEQFYLMAPLLLLNKQRALWAILIGCMSFGYFWLSPEESWFFSPLARAWQLLLGVAVALLLSNKKIPFMSNLASTFSCMVFVFILIALPIELEERWAVFIVSVLAALSFFIQPKDQDFYKKGLIGKIAVGLGLRSYQIYLWHYPIFSLSLWAGMVVQNNWILALIFVLMISEITYRYFEKPLRFQSNRKLVLIALSFSICFIFIFSYLISKSLTLRTDHYRPLISDSIELDYKIYNKNKTSKCHYRLSNFSEVEIEECLSATEDPAIYFLGDSHSEVLRQGFNSIESDFASFGVHANSVPSLIKQPALPFDLKRALEVAKKDDYVVIAFYHGKLNSNLHFHEKFVSDLQKLDNTILRKNLSKYLRDAKEKSVNVILIGDNPKLKRPVRIENCILSIQIWNFDSCGVERGLALETRRPQEKVFSELANEFDNALYLDSFDYVCDEQNCPIFNNGALFYSDYNHLSLVGAASVANGINDLIKERGKSE